MDQTASWQFSYNRKNFTDSTSLIPSEPSKISLTITNHSSLIPTSTLTTSDTAALLIQSPTSTVSSEGFLSSTCVGFDSVFSPVITQNNRNQRQNQPKFAESGLSQHISSKIETLRQILSSPSQRSSEYERDNLTFYNGNSNSISVINSASNTQTLSPEQWSSSNIETQHIESQYTILPQENVITATRNASVQEKLNNSYYSNDVLQNQAISSLHTDLKHCSEEEALSLSMNDIHDNDHSEHYYKTPLPDFVENNVQSNSFALITHPTTSESLIQHNTNPKIEEVNNYITCKTVNMSNETNLNLKERNIISNSSINISSNNNLQIQNCDTFHIQHQPESPVLGKDVGHIFHLVQTKPETKLYPEIFLIENEDRTKYIQIEQEENNYAYCTLVDGKLLFTTTATNPTEISNFDSNQFIISNNSNILELEQPLKLSETNTPCSDVNIPNETLNITYAPKRINFSQNTDQIQSTTYSHYNNSLNTIESSQKHNSNDIHISEASNHFVIYKTDTTDLSQETSNNVVSPAKVDHFVDSNNPVVYSSVITHALTNEQSKLYNQQTSNWNNKKPMPKTLLTFNSSPQNGLLDSQKIKLLENYYTVENKLNNIETKSSVDNFLKTENQITKSIIVTTENPLSSQIQKSKELVKPKRLANTVINGSNSKISKQEIKTRDQLLSENEFLINRIPPSINYLKIPENESNILVTESNKAENTFQVLDQPLFSHKKYKLPSNTHIKSVISTTRPSVCTFSATPSISNNSNIQQSHQLPKELPKSNLITEPLLKTEENNDPNKIILDKNEKINSEIPKCENLITNNNLPLNIGKQKNINIKKEIIKEEIVDKGPQIFVPNIEEELKFLSDVSGKTGTFKLSNTENKKNDKFIVKFNKTVNFLNSYLKFLDNGIADERLSPFADNFSKTPQNTKKPTYVNRIIPINGKNNNFKSTVIKCKAQEDKTNSKNSKTNFSCKLNKVNQCQKISPKENIPEVVKTGIRKKEKISIIENKKVQISLPLSRNPRLQSAQKSNNEYECILTHIPSNDTKILPPKLLNTNDKTSLKIIQENTNQITSMKQEILTQDLSTIIEKTHPTSTLSSKSNNGQKVFFDKTNPSNESISIHSLTVQIPALKEDAFLKFKNTKTIGTKNIQLNSIGNPKILKKPDISPVGPLKTQKTIIAPKEQLKRKTRTSRSSVKSKIKNS